MTFNHLSDSFCSYSRVSTIDLEDHEAMCTYFLGPKEKYTLVPVFLFNTLKDSILNNVEIVDLPLYIPQSKDYDQYDNLMKAITGGIFRNIYCRFQIENRKFISYPGGIYEITDCSYIPIIQNYLLVEIDKPKIKVLECSTNINFAYMGDKMIKPLINKLLKFAGAAPNGRIYYNYETYLPYNITFCRFNNYSKVDRDLNIALPNIKLHENLIRNTLKIL